MLLGLGLGLASDSSFKGQWFVRAGMILWVTCKVRSVRRSAFAHLFIVKRAILSFLPNRSKFESFLGYLLLLLI